MTRTFAGKSTVQASDGVAVLDFTFEDKPTPLSGSESWTYNTYDADDERQRMALAVAWKSKITQPIRLDHTLRHVHMGDIIQAAMVAAYEQPSLKDCERVWYRRVAVTQDDGSTLYVNEMREKVQAMTEAERQTAYLYKHIDVAVRRAVKKALDLHGREALVGESETLETVTAHRIHDAYLKDVEGSEWDRLDAMLEAACNRLHASDAAKLRSLVAGKVTLSQMSSRTRDAVRNAVGYTLHLDGYSKYADKFPMGIRY